MKRKIDVLMTIDGRMIKLNAANCDGQEGNVIPDIIANIRGHIADAKRDPSKKTLRFGIVVNLE